MNFFREITLNNKHKSSFKIYEQLIFQVNNFIYLLSRETKNAAAVVKCLKIL